MENYLGIFTLLDSSRTRAERIKTNSNNKKGMAKGTWNFGTEFQCRNMRKKPKLGSDGSSQMFAITQSGSTGGNSDMWGEI